MHHLSIDIETYSDVDITKAGMYLYVQSSAFEILLFAYSLDGGPVQVADLTQPEVHLPGDAIRWMFDPACIKHAYNATFEWYCLSKFFHLDTNAGYPPEKWLPQWRCTMLHGLYCGYTAGLDATGRALGLPQDKQKMSAGKSLIRYFCSPCKPSKANGGRTRNLPKHDPEKWELFKEYNRQDVVTEAEIERRLSNFPVPDEVQAQWVTDQTINARGVAVDLALVDSALELGATVRERLTAEAAALSGLDNPNSVAQLAKWLEAETGEEVANLQKNTVKDLLEKLKGAPAEGGAFRGERWSSGASETCPAGRDEGYEARDTDAARRMLEIRQELGKTSTKKYDALETCVCADGRVRGLLQFYGANRTGRWAGRLVQVQNLPQTHLAALPLARRLTKERQLDALRVVYGSVPSTLSQLIRTAFVAEEGKTFIDADFSAIEARVIAWLAGEEWVLDVFRTHGKIYEATAAQMFSIPLEAIKKGNPEYSYRAKGKVATLALGYQGGPGALVNMGALRSGLTEGELPEIVARWRQANPNIVRFWYDVERAALGAVTQGAATTVRGLVFARECDPGNGLDFLTIQLPSGRKLYYANPHMGRNRFDRDSLCYYGMNQTTKRWEVVETYGGKLVENITQAVARDCLALAIDRLASAGYPVVFHIHDEVVIEVPAGMADLDNVVKIMSEPIPWAPGLPLGADGWVDDYFKKD